MLYRLTIVMTALMAGFMLSYCITLGSYFNYLLAEVRDEGFSDYYAPFRKSTRVVFWYRSACGLQILLAILSCLLSPQESLPKITALVPFTVLFLCHWLTGFGKSEERINSGLPIDQHHRATYLKWNIPLHVFYFLAFSTSALIQLMYLS